MGITIYRLPVILTVMSLLIALILGCETPLDTEFGTARLYYELESDHLMMTLVDISNDSDIYLLRCYNETTDKRGLWYIDLPDGEPVLITSADYSQYSGWFGNPKISPDKTRVMFLDSSGIFIVPIEGGEPANIYDGGTPTHWIDNETILIYDARYDPTNPGYSVMALNVNTSETIEIVFIRLKPISEWWHMGVDGVWLSPVSGELAVKGSYKEEEFDGGTHGYLRIYNPEMTGYKEFLNPILPPNRPWSPDGTKIGLGWSDEIGYFDVAEGIYVSSWRSQELELSYYAGIWLADSRTMLASEARDDNILRVYAVNIE